MDQETIAVYECEGSRYTARRGVQRLERVQAFRAAVRHGGLRLDLGCGPGHYLALLGDPVVALDGAAAMTRSVAALGLTPAPGIVQGDLSDLPFDRGAFAGVWASKAHQHVPASDLPLALADVHRVLEVGGRFDLTMFRGPGTQRLGFSEEVSTTDSGDDLPGRFFTWWEPDRLTDVVAAAGFHVDSIEVDTTTSAHGRIDISATRERALPDYVAAEMRLLCCGLNPSLHAADAGIAYVTGSNRFWPALALAGLAAVDRDPHRLLCRDGIGLTDLVKRPTTRADELDPSEYLRGVDRLAQLCGWLRPAAVAVVGLAGWRAAVDRKAGVGWQPDPLGGSPVYVLPSTSGLNARVSVAELADHLSSAANGPLG